ncbi:hypothetical protein E4T56_gene12646 [Termitomyces sp. T112]|nr:hypothetical protein E4T56_gene12646 [Termitomyces sp. T112]
MSFNNRNTDLEPYSALFFARTCRWSHLLMIRDDSQIMSFGPSARLITLYHSYDGLPHTARYSSRFGSLEAT